VAPAAGTGPVGTGRCGARRPKFDRLTRREERAGLLAKSLKRVVIKVVRMEDFRPAKSMVEKGEIEQVVGEFRRFLEAAVGGDGANQRISDKVARSSPKGGKNRDVAKIRTEHRGAVGVRGFFPFRPPAAVARPGPSDRPADFAAGPGRPGSPRARAGH
jgi:hypothetical protein